MQHRQLTLHEHIRELRKRLAYSLLVFLIGGGIAYGVHGSLVRLLRRPLHETLYYTSPAGGFNFVMKISVAVGLAVALPVLVFNLVEFARPAMGDHLARKHVRRITALSFILAVGGAVFAFAVVVPMSLRFFHGFSGHGIQSLLSATDYLDFVINTILTFIIIFQLPLVILFIDHIRPLPPRKLLKYDRHVVVGSALLAVLLPFTYDPISQFLIAVPIVLLYNFSIVLLFLRHRSQPKTAPLPAPVMSTQSEPAPALVPKLAPSATLPRQLPRATYQPRLIMDVQPRRLPKSVFELPDAEAV